MALSRRTFLKLSAAAAGSACLVEGMAPGFLRPKQSEASDATVRTVPTVCEMCFWKCGLTARVVENRVVKLNGNPLHPQSRGKLCGRGQGGIGLLYDKDRLKKPLLRTGKRGENTFKTVEWDEALDFIAQRLKKISETYGPESIALFSHGSSGTYFRNLLMAMGSPNITFPSFSQCLGARNVAYELTFGTSPASSCERADLTKSKAAVLFGTHLGENMHNSQVQDFTQAVANGTRFIVVDPRYSTAAAKAHMWLPIRPGTDMALILSWINIVIAEGLYDKEYVAQYTSGFDAVKKAVAPYTPAWAAQETDLPEKDIVEAARILGKDAPNVCVHPGRHFSWHGNDTQRGRAMAILTALLGSWGREGGIWLPPKAALPKTKASTPEYPEPDRESVTTGPYPFAGGEGLTNEVRRATITGQPYPLKAWLTVGTNLIKTLPNQEETRQAIDNLDLLVAVDVMPTDTVMLADVILPEATYLERYDDLFLITQKGAGVAIRQPAIAPLHSSRPGWWIAKELLKRLDLGDYAPYLTMGDKIQQKARGWEIDFKALMVRGYVPVKHTGGPYITQDNQPVFHTPSKKIELASSELEEEGFEPVPQYSRIAMPAAGQFRLLYGRSPVHTFSRTINNQLLNELTAENEIWINQNIATSLGITHGSYVRLKNQDGVVSNRIRAKVTQRIRTDCVYMVHGFDSFSPRMTRAFNKGADDQQLITRYQVDPISGVTGMRVNFVTIEKEA